MRAPDPTERRVFISRKIWELHGSGEKIWSKTLPVSVDKVGRVLLSVLASTCAQLWHEFGLQLLRGVAAVSPCSIARVALQSCQVQLRCLDISVLGRGLAHCAGLSWAMLLAGAPFTKNTAFVYF